MALRLQPRRVRVAGVLVSSFVCVAMLGCLYTGRINSRPRVTITPPAGHLSRGQTVMVAAVGVDDDGDLLRYAWYVVPGECGAPPGADALPTSNTLPPLMFDLPRDDQSTTCVWVTVTDPDGAVSDPAGAALSTSNGPPVAVIDVQM